MNPGWALGPSKIRSCFEHFFDRFWDPFWVPLGLPFGPLGHQNWLQVRSRTALAMHFFAKKRTLKKPRKTKCFSRFLLSNMAPETLQDRPKTPPRRSWRGTFSMFKIVLYFDPFWVRFWVPLGAPLGSKRRPKIDQIRVPGQGRPQEEPQEAPRGSKRPQEGPKRPQDGPRRPQDGPTTAPKQFSEARPRKPKNI